MSLSERLEFDMDERANWWPSVARDAGYSLIEKFDIINHSIRAEPLGECRLTSRVPYEIYSILPYESDICVNFEISVVGNYRLPSELRLMVSRRDIAVINSHLHRFSLTRAVKHCDYRRLPLSPQGRAVPKRTSCSGVD